MKIIFSRICLLGVFALAACGGDSNKPPVTVGDEDDQVTDPNGGQTAPAPWTNVTFTTEDVEIKNSTQPAGERGKLLRSADGTLYYTYFRPGESVAECDIAIFGGGRAPSIAMDVVVAVKGPGATSFSTERIPIGSAITGAKDFVSNPVGLDAAFDSSGRLVVSMPAGGPGQLQCASTDLVVATRSAANTYTFGVPVTDSSSCCAVSATVKELCPESAGQEACESGTDVGAWSAIVQRENGSLAVSYSDRHFSTDEDGLKLADYELWQSGTGGTGVTGIRPWTGFGRWAQLREREGHLITAFSHNFSGIGAHVYVQGDDGTWTGEDQSFGATVGERLQLEVAPNGTVGLAYYAIKDNADRTVDDLWFCESTDGGTTFPAQLCSRPETATIIAGQNPGLAYDSQSRPVLSYYYCGSSGCAQDGLRVSWRDNTGKWWKYNVRNIANNRSGFYSSVVIDPTTDEPIIAFQDLTRGAAMVAYGNF